MFVEIKNSVEEKRFEDFSGGDLFVCDNGTFMVLTDEIFSSRTNYNAVNLETGEPVYFASYHKVISPNNYTLTVEL